MRSVFPLNSIVHIIFGQESVQQIVVRYEAPVCGNRWDAPLHLVLRDGQVDCQVDIFDVGYIGGYILSVQTDEQTSFCSLSINNLLVFSIKISQAISDSLFHGKPVQPNMSTQNAPLAGQISFAFFQFESFLISFPAFTFYTELWPKENLRVYFRVLQGVILFFCRE